MTRIRREVMVRLRFTPDDLKYNRKGRLSPEQKLSVARSACLAVIVLTLINLLTSTGAFLVYAGIGILGLIWGYYFIPETKNITLEEIEEHWRKGTRPNEIHHKSQ